MPDPDGSDDPDRHTFLLPATVYVPPPPSPPPPPPPPPPSSDGALRDDSRDQDHPSTATVSPGLDRSFPARASGMSVSPTPPSSAPSSRSPSPSPSGNYPAYLPPSKDSKPSSFAAESGRKSPRSQLARSAQPTVTPSTRPRQSSIKHLVDRFNQTADEVPPRQQPLPPRHPSRSISPFRTRIISESGRPPRRPDAESPIEPRTNVHPAASAARRRPLFGELPTLNTTTPATGHGRAGLSRRRGSDSSVPSPHPALLDSTDDISPISPTAWYLGHTPRETDKLSQQQRTRSRHRAQSDASWNVARPDTIPHAHMAVTSPPEPPSPSSSLDPGHSRSRIPIPTRRTSHASDSERSSRSSSVVGRSSTHSLTSVPLAPKGTSRLPKPAAKPALPVDVPKHTTGARPVPSPSRRGISRDNPRAASDTSSLKVYVSAPPPKKSPPLRSSRPRQSVSTATTSASRAKVVDRVSRFQSSDSQTNQDSRTPRSRSRQLPELGNVDFAARRQKIQQAFSKSVQETARREQEEAERRRRARERRHEEVRSMLIREGQLRRMRSREAAATPERAAVPQTEGPPVAEPHAHLGELSTSMIVEQKPTALAPSTVEDKGTNSAVDKEQIADSAARAASPQPPQCDSPTLGAPPSSEPAGPSAPMDDRASDGAPPSAMTAETNDTDTTHFDSEPQVSLDHADGGHRDLLSRIMQLRESSSSSECEEDRSDQDDKESIQIMLEPSDSTVFFDAVNSGESGAGHPGDAVHDPRDAPTEGSDAARDDKLKRWSMASWSSSLRDHPSESQADQTEFTAQKADADATEPDGPSPTWAESAEAAEYQRSLGGLLHDEPYLRPFHTRQHSDPDTLVRQGGWDTKRVTKLFLEELTEGILKSPDRPWEVVQAGEEVDSSSRGNNGLTEDPILVPPEDDALHRPSLSVRDDWESVSPSIADWMQVAAADAAATPPQEEQPVAGPQESGETSDSPGFLPPVTSSGESWDGLGLAIHVQSPEEPPPPTEPPMPTYSPPPVPPADTTEVPAPAQSVSPSIYHSQPPSSICPSAPFAEPPAPVRDSEESSMVQSTFASSPRTVASSATSQHQVPPPPAHPPPPPVPQDQVSVQRPSSPTPEQRRLNKRRNVIKELVDTEYTYGRDMKVVDDIYKGTSSSCLDLSPEDVRVLFGNSDQIVHFSMTFLDGLKQAARSVYVMPKSKRWGSKRRTGNGGGDSQHSDSRPSGAGVDIIDENQDRQTFVGRVFLENLPQMEKVYTEYLKNHDAANRKLQSLQRNQKVAIWLRECREWASDLTAAWDLDSLLVKPVQRILKYPLLLNELIDATPADHPDRESLVAAVNGVTQISVRINELKKRADLVGQVVSSRKRKDSDVRSGLSKAFGRRTEKLKQQVGLSEMVQDKQYDALAQQFNDSYFQLQVVMRDVEMYTREVQTGLNKLLDIALAVDRFLDVAPAHGKYIEYESKWRRLRVIVRDIVNIALPDHVRTASSHLPRSPLNPFHHVVVLAF